MERRKDVQELISIHSSDSSANHDSDDNADSDKDHGQDYSKSKKNHSSSCPPHHVEFGDMTNIPSDLYDNEIISIHSSSADGSSVHDDDNHDKTEKEDEDEQGENDSVEIDSSFPRELYNKGSTSFDDEESGNHNTDVNETNKIVLSYDEELSSSKEICSATSEQRSIGIDNNCSLVRTVRSRSKRRLCSKEDNSGSSCDDNDGIRHILTGSKRGGGYATPSGINHTTFLSSQADSDKQRTKVDDESDSVFSDDSSMYDSSSTAGNHDDSEDEKVFSSGKERIITVSRRHLLSLPSHEKKSANISWSDCFHITLHGLTRSASATCTTTSAGTVPSSISDTTEYCQPSMTHETPTKKNCYNVKKVSRRSSTRLSISAFDCECDDEDRDGNSVSMTEDCGPCMADKNPNKKKKKEKQRRVSPSAIIFPSSSHSSQMSNCHENDDKGGSDKTPVSCMVMKSSRRGSKKKDKRNRARDKKHKRCRPNVRSFIDTFSDLFIPPARAILGAKLDWTSGENVDEISDKGDFTGFATAEEDEDETRIKHCHNNHQWTLVADFWLSQISKLQQLTDYLEGIITQQKRSQAKKADGGAFGDPNRFSTVRSVLKLVVALDTFGHAMLQYGVVDSHGTYESKGKSSLLTRAPSRILLWEIMLGKWTSRGKMLDPPGILRQLARLVKWELIQRAIRFRSLLDKYFVVTEKELDQCVAFSFSLHLLSALVENIFEDARLFCVAGKHSHSTFKRHASNEKGFFKVLLSNFFRNEFGTEQCTLCDKKESIVECDTCRTCFHEKEMYVLPMVITSEGITKRDEEITTWLCPMCTSADHLLKAVQSNDLHKIYDLMILQGASPLVQLTLATTTYSGARQREITTPLHVAVLHNNYEMASMLLYGAFVLLQDRRVSTLLRGMFPQRCWGRAKATFQSRWMTPFESGVDQSRNNFNVVPPYETLLLLCSRGGGDRKILDGEHKIRCTLVNIKNSLSGSCLNQSLASEGSILPQNDISLGLEAVEIPWVNETGDGEKLSGFVYVTRPVESSSTGIQWYSCRNSGCIHSGRLLSWRVIKQERCRLQRRGQFEAKQGVPDGWSCECNYLSPCFKNRSPNPVFLGRMDVDQCGNRSLSVGIRYKLEVFRTSDGRGWGLRTAKDQRIERGSVVCSYGGLYLRDAEYRRFERPDSKDVDALYGFDLHSHNQRSDKDDAFVIDAMRFRSAAGFINHVCAEPNLEAFKTLGNHLDSRYPFIGFRATRNIMPLTELCFNYGGRQRENVEGHCRTCDEWHCLCKFCCQNKHDRPN